MAVLSGTQGFTFSCVEDIGTVIWLLLTQLPAHGAKLLRSTATPSSWLVEALSISLFLHVTCSVENTSLRLRTGMMCVGVSIVTACGGHMT